MPRLNPRLHEAPAVHLPRGAVLGITDRHRATPLAPARTADSFTDGYGRFPRRLGAVNTAVQRAPGAVRAATKTS